MTAKPDMLTPGNCQLIIIDHQPRMAFGCSRSTATR